MANRDKCSFYNYTAAHVFILCVCTISKGEDMLLIGCLELMVIIFQIPNVAKVTEMGRDL